MLLTDLRLPDGHGVELIREVWRRFPNTEIMVISSKFCVENIGKPPEMNACLRENKTKLSDSSRKVVESHGG